MGSTAKLYIMFFYVTCAACGFFDTSVRQERTRSVTARDVNNGDAKPKPSPTPPMAQTCQFPKSGSEQYKGAFQDGRNLLSVKFGELGRLKNNADCRIEIKSLKVRATNQDEDWVDSYSQICIFRNVLLQGQNHQNEGEILCLQKLRGQENYDVPELGDFDRFTIILEQNDTLYVQFDNGGLGRTHELEFEVAAVQAEPQKSWNAIRFPLTSEQITCTQAEQSTSWFTWQNNQGSSLVLGDTYITAFEDDRQLARVDQACVYLFDSKSHIKWQKCFDELTQSGLQQVLKGKEVAAKDYLALQATHTCSAGSWQWAAYVNVSSPLLDQDP